MRLRFFALTALLFLATAASAKEVWLSIGGSVGVFRTDARIFNPSTTKDIQIQAYYLPAGNNVDNSGVQPISITVLKRQQLVYNDVVTSLFHSSGLGAIRLKSDDDFIATQKIYAVTAAGTLGQFVVGVDASGAKAKGVIIQLQAAGSFKTNIGAVNPNGTTATVTWRLYDKNSAPVGNPKVITMVPYGVISPGGIAGYTDSVGSADLTDAWLSYSSDQPIVAYGSVIDNGTTNPTYVPAAEDTGVAIVTPPATGNNFNVTTRSSIISIAPVIGQGTLKPGDTVTFNFSGHDTTHGFRLLDPDGSVVLDVTVPPDAAVFSRTVTLSAEGTYQYFCTITTCSAGHNNMQGSFPVGNPSSDPPPRY